MNMSEFPTMGIVFAKAKVMNAIGSPCEMAVFANKVVIEEGGMMFSVAASHIACVSFNYHASNRLYRIAFDLDAERKDTVLENCYYTENRSEAYQLYDAFMKILK